MSPVRCAVAAIEMGEVRADRPPETDTFRVRSKGRRPVTISSAVMLHAVAALEGTAWLDRKQTAVSAPAIH